MWDSVGIEALDGSSPSYVQAKPVKEPTAPPKHLPAVASKSYSVASIWEKSAVLTNDQQQAIEILSSTCNQRPFPNHIPLDIETTPSTDNHRQSTQDSGPLSPHGEAMEQSFAGTSFEDVTLQNSSEFYKWLSELEAVRAIETESKYQHHTTILNQHLSSCDSLLSTIDHVFDLFNNLKEGQKTVSDRTAALHVVCENLVHERDALLSTIDALQQKLSFFDVLETIPVRFQSLTLEDSNILPLLQQLDQSVEFIGTHPEYADAPAYSVKLKQLQSRVLSALRAMIQQSMKDTAQSVMVASSSSSAQRDSSTGKDGGDNDGSVAATETDALLQSSSSSTTTNTNTNTNTNSNATADTMMQYVRFRAALQPSLKSILQGIQERSSFNQEYSKLLRECYTMHCNVRLSLTKGPVLAHLKAQRGHALPAVLRAGCLFLMHIAQLETQIFEQLFPIISNTGNSSGGHSSSNITTTNTTTVQQQQQLTTTAALAPLMDTLCSMLYDMLRPGFVALRDVDELCELASIVRIEVLEDSVLTAENEYQQLVQRNSAKQSGNTAVVQQNMNRSTASLLLDPVMRRCLADIQEKIAFRSHAYLRENINNFVPSQQDVDYPNCLIVVKESNDNGGGGGGGDSNDGDNDTTNTINNKSTSDNNKIGWYPPVQRALHLLSKIYQELPSNTFAGLAHEAIVNASSSVKDGARSITDQRQSSPSQQQQQQAAEDGEQQQLSLYSLPSSLHSQLFSVKQLLLLREGISSLHADFSVVERDLDFAHLRQHLSQTVAGRLPLFSFSSRNAVVENQSDARRDLDRQLKIACEGVIMEVTKMAVEPALAFLTKVTAVAMMGGDGDNDNTTTEQQQQQHKALKDHAFASVERITEVATAINTAIQSDLVNAIKALKLYLPSSSTQEALLKPIKGNVVEAYEQLSRLIEKEYSSADAVVIGLMEHSVLENLLMSV